MTTWFISIQGIRSLPASSTIVLLPHTWNGRAETRSIIGFCKPDATMRDTLNTITHFTPDRGVPRGPFLCDREVKRFRNGSPDSARAHEPLREAGYASFLSRPRTLVKGDGSQERHSSTQPPFMVDAPMQLRLRRANIACSARDDCSMEWPSDLS